MATNKTTPEVKVFNAAPFYLKIVELSAGKAKLRDLGVAADAMSAATARIAAVAEKRGCTFTEADADRTLQQMLIAKSLLTRDSFTFMTPAFIAAQIAAGKAKASDRKQAANKFFAGVEAQAFDALID